MTTPSKHNIYLKTQSGLPIRQVRLGDTVGETPSYPSFLLAFQIIDTRAERGNYGQGLPQQEGRLFGQVGVR